jgi:hypothetical protein
MILKKMERKYSGGFNFVICEWPKQLEAPFLFGYLTFYFVVLSQIRILNTKNSK